MSHESLRPCASLEPPPLTGAWRLLTTALRLPALPVQGLVPSALFLCPSAPFPSTHTHARAWSPSHAVARSCG